MARYPLRETTGKESKLDLNMLDSVTQPQRTKLPSIPISAKNNPYKAQKSWPPNFANLHPKYQFRLERRYRRRMKLKWLRPGWTRGVTLAARGSCLAVLAYGVLWMDWGTERTPFLGIRGWLKEQTNSIWTTSSVQPNIVTVDNGSKHTTPQDDGRRS